MSETFEQRVREEARSLSDRMSEGPFAVGFSRGFEAGALFGRTYTEEERDEMVSRALAWHVPKTVSPDLCAMDREYKRYGTNFFTAIEMRDLLETALGMKPEQ